MILLVKEHDQRVLNKTANRFYLIVSNKLAQTEKYKHSERAQIEEMSIVNKTEREHNHNKHVKNFTYTRQYGPLKLLKKWHKSKNPQLIIKT